MAGLLCTVYLSPLRRSEPEHRVLLLCLLTLTLTLTLHPHTLSLFLFHHDHILLPCITKSSSRLNQVRQALDLYQNMVTHFHQARTLLEASFTLQFLAKQPNFTLGHTDTESRHQNMDIMDSMAWIR